MVELTKKMVSKDLVARLPKSAEGTLAVYQCPFPIESPEFRKPQEVMGWYASLSQQEKLAFKKTDGFIISELKVALHETIHNGEVYHRGEIIEELDCFKYSFTERRWIKCK